MGKKLGYAAFAALIMLICLIPSLGMLLPSQGEAGGNQTLASAPALRDGEGNLNRNYLSQMLDYLEDNYFLRQKMITGWSALNTKLLRSSITEDVVLGSEGWLYFGDTLEDYTGTNPMTEYEIASAAHNLALMGEYCESQSTSFLFTLAPNKNSLYPEHMPDLPRNDVRSNAERLAECLARERVEYLDLFALFRERPETLYFQTDSHWNSQGAALAADALNEALNMGRTTRYFDAHFRPELVHKGDLYDMLYPAGDGLDTDWTYCGDALQFEYDAPIRSAENLTIMTHGQGDHSLLMFRDSFGNLLYPYMADSSGAALFSRAPDYRLDLIPEREADRVVVVELVERNIRYLIQNVPLMPAPSRSIGSFDWKAVDFAVPMERNADKLPGYILVTGTLPVVPDPDTAVYLDGFEAFRLENGGFAAYIPEDALGETDPAVYFTSDGVSCVSGYTEPEGEWRASLKEVQK